MSLEEENKIIDEAYEKLINGYLSSKHRKKVEKIDKAFRFARRAHEGIRRRSGEPYILHPIAVATIVSQEIGLGSTSICAALLHDVVEDTEYTLDDIKSIFGDELVGETGENAVEAVLMHGLRRTNAVHQDIMDVVLSNVRQHLCVEESAGDVVDEVGAFAHACLGHVFPEGIDGDDGFWELFSDGFQYWDHPLEFLLLGGDGVVGSCGASADVNDVSALCEHLFAV